jgi:hypothetical protein
MIMLAPPRATELSPEISIQNILCLPEGSGYGLNAIAIKKLDGSRPHTAGDHYVRFLGVDEFRNFAGNVILEVRVVHDLPVFYFLAVEI